MNQIEQMLNSREVAEMVGKRHDHLIRDIKKYIEEMAAPNLGEGEKFKIEPSDFFRESTYKDINNQNRPCYDVTKKGCEFIAHKLTGIKGTEFTAKYINRFHDMENQLMNPLEGISAGLQDLSPQLQFLINMELKQKEMDKELCALKNQASKQNEAIQTVKDAMASSDMEQDFSKWVIASIKKIAESKSFEDDKYRYQSVWSESYKRLTNKAGCNLELQLKNAKARALKNGATKAQVKNISKLSIISGDKKLKELYIASIKEMMVAYCVEVA